MAHSESSKPLRGSLDSLCESKQLILTLAPRRIILYCEQWHDVIHSHFHVIFMCFINISVLVTFLVKEVEHILLIVVIFKTEINPKLIKILPFSIIGLQH